MPHGQMIIEAQLGCFCGATGSKSRVCVCVGGGICVPMHMCAYSHRTEREAALIPGRKLTWRPGRRDELTRARWPDSKRAQ